MKYLLAILSTIILFSCANDLDLIEEGKDIPVIYSLLSSVDTAQYFRIEKAFADEVISAVDLAKDPSQLYYDNVRVALIHEPSNSEYIFEKVDGATEGYPRVEGAFAQIPNTLYKKRSSEINLVGGDSYRLEVLRDGSDTPVQATTVLTETFKITAPVMGGLIDLVPDGISALRWRGNETISLYDIVLELNILEKDESLPNSFFQSRTLRWTIVEGKVVEPEVTPLEHEVEGIGLYSFMAGALEKDPKWTRIFGDIDVIISAGGVEIQNYRSVGLANLGITSSQDIPTYTNLSEGRGIFSSVTKVVQEDVTLNQRSLDSLKNNLMTRDLGF